MAQKLFALCVIAAACLVSVGAQTTGALTCTYDYNRINPNTDYITTPFQVDTLATCCASCKANSACAAFNYRFAAQDPVQSNHFCQLFGNRQYSLQYLYGSHFGYIPQRITGQINITGAPTTTSTGVQTTGVQSTGAQTTGVRTTGAQSTGVQTTGGQTTGVRTTGAQSTGVQSTAAQTTAGQSTGVQSTAAQSTGVQSTAAQTTGVRTTNVQSTGTQTTGSQSTGVQTTGFQTTSNSPNFNFVSCLGAREPFVDYWVGYINRTVFANESACCAGCQAFSGCNAYSYSLTDGTCYYRAYRGALHSTGYPFNSGYRPNATAPAATGFSCAAATTNNNTDYYGPNLSQTLTASASDCCSACTQYQGCGAYSFSQSDNVCYIKAYAGQSHITANYTSGYTLLNALTTGASASTRASTS